jgi:hypothetical protein
MYNPSQNDNYNEWVEIYTNETVNLENFTLCNISILSGYINDSDQETYLNTTYEIPANRHALITDGGSGTQVYYNFNVSNDSSAFHVDSGYLCGGLSNTNNKTLLIKDPNGTIIENVTYAPTAQEGKALCFINNWQACEPTPGYENFINESNETNITKDGSKCDISLIIDTDKEIFDNEAIGYNLIINDLSCNNTGHEIYIDYWAEDLFGNVVRDTVNTTKNITCYLNIDRTWTPDDVIGSEAYTIKANITNPNCNDTNITNNFYEKTIIFRGTEPQEKSYIKIINYTSGAKYGESIDIKVEIYKNSTAKYAVYAYVTNGSSKLSQETTMHVKTKNTLYNMTIPIQLKPNCDSDYANGNQIIVVEGLDLTATATISINGISSANCKTVHTSSGSTYSSSSSSSSVSTTTQNEYEIISYPSEVYIGEEFEVIVRVNASQQKNVSVYSYVHSGKDLVSLGYNNKWLATWNANKRSLLVKIITLTLKNKIKDDAQPGTYNLRVRFVDTKEHDIDRAIIVMKKEVKENITNGTELGNEAGIDVAVKEPGSTGLLTTGMFAAKPVSISKERVFVIMLIIKNIILQLPFVS